MTDNPHESSIKWHACEGYNSVDMCSKSIMLHCIKYIKLFPWVPHKTWRRDGRTGSIPCGHWKDAGTFPPPNAKELGMCVTVNWYPPSLSISLDSEEGEGRVQWKGLEWHVRCGICGVLCMRGECVVRCGTWSVARCGICRVLCGVGSRGTWQSKHLLLKATVSTTVKPSSLPWLWCDCVWRTHDSGEWLVCNAVLAT